MKDLKPIIDNYISTIKKIKSDIWWNITTIVILIALFSLLPNSMIFIMPVANYYSDKVFPGWDFWLLIFTLIASGFGVILSFYLSEFLFKIIINPILNKITKISENIINLHKEILWTIESIENIENILNKTESIQFLQKKLFRMRSFVWIFNPKNWTEFARITKESLIWCIEILANLRSDLQLRLTEQQKTLESAKSEVEKNITWTTELNQVSELQRARLDKQIEQFKELQRVLVKV